ncbi:hypothetical protein ON010_g18618 [Phytophthora cinnamomi]|nr:hypothetical protein ON010_g18618 [Phytophthora cinnamomi]
MAILELQRRQVRADRFMVTTPTETKPPAEQRKQKVNEVANTSKKLLKSHNTSGLKKLENNRGFSSGCGQGSVVVSRIVARKDEWFSGLPTYRELQSGTSILRPPASHERIMRCITGVVTSYALKASSLKGNVALWRWFFAAVIVLSKSTYRFCSRACGLTVFNADDSDLQESTPISISGKSCSSIATVIDPRETELEGTPAVVNSVPDHITHGPPANTTDPIWILVHQLGKPVTYKKKQYTHIRKVCLETKTWQNALCHASHASNATTHLVSAHKTHEMAILELQRRQVRADRFMVTTPTETKTPAEQRKQKGMH